MKRTSRAAASGLALAAALAAFASCRPDDDAGKGETRPKVATVKAALESIPQDIESFGSIAFERKSDLSPIVEGVVADSGIKEGSRVGSGQVLLKLRNPQLEMRAEQMQSAYNSAAAGLELARSQLWEGQLQIDARLQSVERDEMALAQKKIELEQAERSLKNKEELFSAGGLSEEAIVGQRQGVAGQRSAYQLEKKDLEIKRIGLRDEDLAAQGTAVPKDPAEWRAAIKKLNTQTLESQVYVARMRLDAAKTDLDSARKSLDDLTIRAPMDGLVGAKYVERGEQVQTQTKLLTVMQVGAIFAVFPISEMDAGRVREGMPVEVSLDAFGGKRWRASVYLVSPILDSATGSVSVKARMDNPGGAVKPGMFARVKVVVGPPQRAPVLPQTCFVRKQGNEGSIYTVVNGRIFVKQVLLGKNVGGRFVVERGLSPGDLVVDNPSPLLKEGQAVDG